MCCLFLGAYVRITVVSSGIRRTDACVVGGATVSHVCDSIEDAWLSASWDVLPCLGRDGDDEGGKRGKSELHG